LSGAFDGIAAISPSPFVVSLSNHNGPKQKMRSWFDKLTMNGTRSNHV
jgi:hypothetical protein